MSKVTPEFANAFSPSLEPSQRASDWLPMFAVALVALAAGLAILMRILL